jgi:hypothetical protein
MAINLQDPNGSSNSGASSQTKTIVITVIAVIIVAAAAGNYLKNKKSDSSNDLDKDGIADTIDKCPDIAGTVEFSGCPTDAEATADNSEMQSPTATSRRNEAESNKSVTQPEYNRQNQVATSQQPNSNRANEVQTAPMQEPVNRMTIVEPEPEEITVKNVSAKLKTNSGANTISWNSELSRAKDLLLTISTASGLNFKKDVTGLNSYTFNPGSGEWQGKKCTVTLSSSDPKIAIDNSKLPNTFFNCSAE